MFLGVCHPRERLDLMRAAGIGWLRADVPFPFADAAGALTPAYVLFRERVFRWGAAGFSVMGITPYPRGWPADYGDVRSRRFLDTYLRACAFMAADLAPHVCAWQVCNEMNLAYFRRPYATEAECVPFLVAGGLGVREGNPRALLGVNMATGHEPSAERMYRMMVPCAEVAWDYVGVDAYYGTWEKGGPDTWIEKLDWVRGITGHVPIIVMEFGYTSKGGCMTAEERGPQDLCSVDLHTTSKWPYAWNGGHTPDNQALYAKRALGIFRSAPDILGAFWYMWADGEQCQCGNPQCPENSGYGMVTLAEEPKPAYEVFRAAAK